MSRIKKVLLIVGFGAVIYFPLFLHLDYAPLYHWDESRNAINAFEMAHNNNYFVRYFNGNPDTWETKPPFLVWMQILTMKIVGFNELGVRLPSAISTLFIILLIIWFCHKEFNNTLGGVLASFVLICSKGFICIHVSRTGDHDAMLSFFLLFGSLSYFKFIESETGKLKYLTITSIAMILGVLTKSIAGLFFLPGFALYTLYRRKLTEALSNRMVYLAIFLFLLIIGGYYFIGEQLHPGHLKMIWENELFPRYTNTSEIYNYKIPDSKFYYINLILAKQFSFFWILFICSGLFFILTRKYQELRKFIIFLLILIAVFLIIISLGSVNSWYNAPVFPLMAIVVGLGLSEFIKLLTDRFLSGKSGVVRYSVAGLIVIAIFAFPYKSIVQSIYMPGNSDQYGKMMKKLKKSRPEDNNYFVFYEYNNSHFIFYEKVYNTEYNYKINSCSVRGPLESCSSFPGVGEEVLICNEGYFKEFSSIFDYTMINNHKSCKFLKITSKKD